MFYFIFLNGNRFEKYVMGNIEDDCCKLVFIWIRICNVIFQTFLPKLQLQIRQILDKYYIEP